MNKIGFACKWIDRPDQVNGLKANDSAKQYNTGTTTVAWLNRQTKQTAETKLRSLIKQNTTATLKLVQKVGALDEPLRMLRLSSDILPVYTHPDYKWFYSLPDTQEFLSNAFAKIGNIARDNNIRLSFHPGQFCVLSSDRPEVVANSIEEFEYHADMARWMGYGAQFQDMKINVHISGKNGAAGFRAAYNKLSDVAKNCITVENDEYTFGLDECLDLADLCPIVLDIHHHWVKTGEHISADDSRIQTIIQSWRGVVPTIHYSNSVESIWINDYPDTKPDYAVLLESGVKRQHLRAHSDFYINPELNRWALSHLSWANIMAESKGKNLASFALFEEYKNVSN